MIIIIDGYNYLKSATGTKFVSEDKMREWIHALEKYVYYRGNHIIVVFDAGPYLFASSDRYGSVEVWYAGQYQTADDWIKTWLLKNREKDLLLVSSDREIRNCADRLNLVSISSQEFFKIFNAVLEQQEDEHEIHTQSVYKTKQDELSDDFLDHLMEVGSRNIVSAHKENEYTHETHRLSKDKHTSKLDKFFLKKINKI